MNYLEAKGLSGPSSNKSRIAPRQNKTEPEDDGPEATEAAEKLAAENCLDISTITGSGEGGRVLARDVQAAIAAKDGNA